LIPYVNITPYLKKILLTGHSGFIGSHLVDSLSNKYQVVCLAKKILPKSGLTQIKQDIQKINVNKIPKNVSHIMHLAALTDVLYCQNNPDECFDVNVKGTQKMLEVARKLDSKFVFISTGHVFGTPKKLPINENHPKNPTSIYSGSKLAGEILCESYSQSYGLDVSIVRLFSIYGPRSPPHLVTSRIISQLLTNNILYLGNLRPKRDFLYVGDAINAVELVLRKLRGFNSYNVGSGKSHSISELCKILTKISGKKISIKSRKSTLRKNDIYEIVANSSKIRTLGWKPKTELHEGLQLTYDWFKSQNYARRN